MYRSIFIGLRLEFPVDLYTCIENEVLLPMQQLGGIRIESPHNLHITIRFIGPGTLEQGMEIMEQGWDILNTTHPTSITSGPMAISFTHVRGFGSKNLPCRILYLQPAQPNDRLLSILQAYGEEHVPLQTPHLTLARVRNGRESTWATQHLVDKPIAGDGDAAICRGISLLANDGSGSYKDLILKEFTQ